MMAPSSSLSSGLRADRSSVDESESEAMRPWRDEVTGRFLEEYGLGDF